MAMPMPAVNQEPGGSTSQLPGGYVLTDEDFHNLVELVHVKVGIHLTDTKRGLVYTRLARRLGALRLSTFAQYRDYLEGHEEELDRFIDSLTTNHTDFFRETHHFDHLRQHVIEPAVQAWRSGHDRRLRIWSAGCSMGHEPYSIALTLAGALTDGIARERDRHAVDARILATDIDAQVLDTGRDGVYDADTVKSIPSRFGRFMTTAPDGSVTMGQDLKRRLVFKRLNLLEAWPFAGPFDAIFCRNVMIYFDVPTKRRLTEQFVQCLSPGGMLYIGHSEQLDAVSLNLRPEGQTAYRKTP